MVSLVRSRTREKASRRVLITSLIIALCSMLLFAIGVACDTYENADGAASSRSSVLPQSPQTGDTIDLHAVISADPHAKAVVIESPGSTALVGSALCVLGVICGLVFTVLLRRLWRRPLFPDRGLTPVAWRSVSMPRLRPRATALSLTQLSLSRV